MLELLFQEQQEKDPEFERFFYFIRYVHNDSEVLYSIDRSSVQTLDESLEYVEHLGDLPVFRVKASDE